VRLGIGQPGGYSLAELRSFESICQAAQSLSSHAIQGGADPARVRLGIGQPGGYSLAELRSFESICQAAQGVTPLTRRRRPPRRVRRPACHTRHATPRHTPDHTQTTTRTHKPMPPPHLCVRRRARPHQCPTNAPSPPLTGSHGDHASKGNSYGNTSGMGGPIGDGPRTSHTCKTCHVNFDVKATTKTPKHCPNNRYCGTCVGGSGCKGCA
jgi:hypothetical protein